MNHKRLLWVFALSLSLIFAACSSTVEILPPTATPMPPTAEPVLGIDTPIQIGETEVRITSVELKDHDGTYTPQLGYGLMTVSVAVSAGPAQAVADWAITLNGNRPYAHGTGVFYEGDAGWDFSIPDSDNTFQLRFPNGTVIHITTLIPAA